MSRQSAMVGIDPDNFFEYSEKHGTSSLPPMEEVAFDEDDPAGAYARMFKKSYVRLKIAGAFMGMGNCLTCLPKNVRLQMIRNDCNGIKLRKGTIRMSLT